MSRATFSVALGLFTCLAVLPVVPVRGQVSELARRVPDRPNAVILLDVEKIFRSPMAEAEGWRKTHRRAFEHGMIMVPPTATRFVMASQLDLDLMAPIWEAALLNVSDEISIPQVAQQRGGTVDVVAEESTAVLPDDTYVIKFGPILVGAMRPANRQSVGRWIEDSRDNNRQPLPPYLQEAVGFVQDVGTPIILALDVENALSPAWIRPRLDEVECLKGKSVDLDKLSEALASMRGVTLGITLVDKRYGGLKIDFAEDVSMTADFAKPLLLECLGRRGAMIDEFNDWTVNVTSKQITLKGELDASGLRRVLSLLEPPHWPDYRTPPQSSSATPDEQTVALASMEYYKTIETMLNDLRGKRKSDEFVTWGQVGLWFERYARKIDDLPILNVDSELLDYGVFVADSLRQSETAMKGIGAKSAYRKTETPNVQAYSGVSVAAYGPYGGGAYGYRYGYNPRLSIALDFQQDAQIRTQERIQGNANAHFIMQGIDQATAAIRRSMTQKYKMEF